MTLASKISLSRIFLIIPIIYLSSLSIGWSDNIAILIFLIAASTDFLDGYVARKTKTETDLGSILDLLADKIFVVSMFIWILFSQSNSQFLLPVLLIVSRELVISSLRQFYAEKSLSKKLAVSYFGKVKTFSHMIVLVVFLKFPNGSDLHVLKIILLWFCVLIALSSLYKYLAQSQRLNS